MKVCVLCRELEIHNNNILEPRSKAYIEFIANYFVYINFIEILKLGKGENDTQLSKLTQAEQDTYEMQVRAANIGKIIKESTIQPNTLCKFTIISIARFISLQ